MTSIVEKVDVSESADAVWREIGEFGAVGQWHPWLERVESEGERPGSRRVPVDREGRRQTEQLLEMAPERHFYRYRIEKTPLPIRNWRVELRVEEQGPESSTVVWSAELQPMADEEKAVAAVRGFMRAGLDNLRTLQGGNRSQHGGQ